MSDTTISASSDHAATPKRRRRWLVPVIGAGACIFGIGIGAAGASGEEGDTQQVETLQGTVDDLTRQLDDAKNQLADMDARNAELDEQAQELADREAKLDDRKAGLDDREAQIEKTELEVAEGTIPGDGIFLVGDDIQPGTYRSSAGDCYWARLSGTSGEFDDIIANGNGAAVVTINDADVAFESRYCGEWKIVE